MTTTLTTDHRTIRTWAEAHGAQPAHVRPGHGGEPKAIRFHFPTQEAKDVELISWEAFFDRFEKWHLAMIFEDLPGREIDDYSFVDRRKGH